MCAQALTGCPARSGSRPGRGQPAHRLGERVVVPLALGPVVFLAGRGGQRVQHRGHRGGALGGQVAVQDAGAADRGGQLHLAVGELPLRILIGEVPAGAHVHLGEQARQVRQPQPAGEGGQQLLITRVAVLLRELAGPQADRPRRRFGDLPGGQRRQHPRMRGGPLGPRGVPDGGAAGDPGAVDQPGHRAVVPVPGVPLPGGERGQEPGPRRGQRPRRSARVRAGTRPGWRRGAGRRRRRPGTPARRGPCPAPHGHSPGPCTHLVTSSPGLVAAAGATCRPREGQASRI